ncbi:MAG: ATP-binding protein [Planctomycetia bacterium]|nr:ATP-binding protein [Planctomycetia bacterium]
MTSTAFSETVAPAALVSHSRSEQDRAQFASRSSTAPSGDAKQPVEPSQSCICGGLGVILSRDEKGRVFARSCHVCRIQQKRRVDALLKNSGIPEACATNFTISPIAADYVTRFPQLRRSNSWILFAGKPGAGKTTQAAWLAREIVTRYQARVRFYTAFDLTRRLTALKRRNDQYERVFQDYLHADLVVVDDFLKTIPSRNSFNFEDFHATTIELLWSRYDARRPVAITTQCAFDQIAQFDSALASRIVESCDSRVVAYRADAVNWRLQSRARNPIQRQETLFKTS